MKDNKISVHVIDSLKPLKQTYNWMFTQIKSNSSDTKVDIIACPCAELCRFLVRKFQETCMPEELHICNNISQVPKNIPSICIVPYSTASSDSCLSSSEKYWIIEGHSISSYEHFASLNRLLAELSKHKKQFTIFLDSIPALKSEFNNLSEQFVDRYKAQYTALPCKKFEDEVIVECCLDSGVEVVLGELQYYEDRNRSECPLTDTLLSIVGGCLKENKRMVIICGNDAEAKDIAERIDTEFHSILIKQELPTSRIALSVSLKLVGAVVYAANNPYYEKDDGFIPFIISKKFLIVIGSKKRLLYTGYEADIVLNIIFTGSEKAMLDAEYSALFNLTVDENSSVITLTDSVANAFSQFDYQPRLFNRTVINLINNGQIKNMDQLAAYTKNCFINDFDYAQIVQDLSKNGAIMEINGEFEVLGCKFLSGFYATEKRRLLSEALSALNLKDILYLFFLANVYFVDASETLTLPRTSINSLLVDPEVKALCERVKLHDPRIRGNHYMKLEASVVISSILYKYFQNVSDENILTWVNDVDRLNVFLILNQQNFRKTFKIAQDLSTSFAGIFKHLENICSQFNLSSLKRIRGLDFETVDLLISAGIKSARDFVHASNLEIHLRALANKRQITVRQLYEELRNEALTVHKPLKRLSLNSSGNTSRDIFSASNVGEEIVFKSLCVQNETNLNQIFTLPSIENGAIILHVRDSDYLNILRIDEKVTVFEQILNCCEFCENEKRMNEILKICVLSNLFVTNMFDASDAFATAENSFDVILKANCLTAMAYVIGQNDISIFVKNCTTKAKDSWQYLYHCIVTKQSFSQELVYCFQNLVPFLIQLTTISQVQMVQQAFSVLSGVYQYGIPYSGHNILMKKYKEKLSSMPPEVIKIANSKFITPEFHKEFADNCDLLLQTKRAKPTKLISTDAATSEQSDIIYSQLSQIRKLNQAIDLFKVRCFVGDSGVVKPLLDIGGNGRLYTHYPNLQNFAKSLPFQDLQSPRSIIRMPTAERELWSADFKEIELRVAASLSKDSELLKALKTSNTFQYIAEKLEIDDFPRPTVKLFFYGLLYGMGPNTLVEQYKFDRDEALALWNRFNRVFSELDHYRNILCEEVKQRKLLTNYYGIPVNVDIASAFSAVNAVIQSTAACILLQAVGKFTSSNDNNDIRLLFTVHDEIIFDAPSSMHDKIPQIVSEYMKNEIDGILLPIKLSVGKSWDTLEVCEF